LFSGDPARWLRILERSITLGLDQRRAGPCFAPETRNDKPRNMAAIVNTGSKQGITKPVPPYTTPPTASSKGAGRKVVKRGAAPRIFCANIEGCRVERAPIAHSGFVFHPRPMTPRALKDWRNRPPAWTPEPLVDFKMAAGDGTGRRLHLCPRQTTWPRGELDEAPASFGRGRQLVENRRRPLPRWHPELQRRPSPNFRQGLRASLMSTLIAAGDPKPGKLRERNKLAMDGAATIPAPELKETAACSHSEGRNGPTLLKANNAGDLRQGGLHLS